MLLTCFTERFLFDDRLIMYMLARKLVGHTILHFKRKLLHRFLLGAKQSRLHQHTLLFNQLKKHADSDFGRQHHFRTIRSLDDFRHQLPISDYGYFEPYIERVKRGETTALFHPDTRVLMFALTSGTTATPKFIPITETFLKRYRLGWQIWGVAVYDQHPRMRDAHILQLTSDWDSFRTEADIPCGQISGLATHTQGHITKMVYCVPEAVSKIADSTAKAYAALRFALCREHIGMAMTANPSTLTFLAKLGNQMKEGLVRDLHDGTLLSDLDISNKIRNQLEPYVRRREIRRARQLENIIRQTNTLLPKDYWNTLALLAVWTGGSVTPYLRELPKYYGQVPVRDHGLSASEGRMTIPFQDDCSYGVLDYCSHFFEFVPKNEHGGVQPTILEAHELQEGQEYFILLTTASGLYRYDIQDLVRCVGFEAQAPLLEFLNKGNYFSSLTGEKLSEFQVVDAVDSTMRDHQLTLGTFTVCPHWDDPPFYQLLIERSDLPEQHVNHPPFIERLANKVDKRLQVINMEYRNKRETQRLACLRIHLMPPDTWKLFRDQQLNQGGSLEQFKHPRLVPQLDFLKKLNPHLP